MESLQPHEQRANQSQVLADSAVHGALPERKFDPGVGATEEFNLRVSTAVLGRMHFIHPETGEEYLVFERKCSAQLKEGGEYKTNLNTQPLGGASVLKNPEALWTLIGGFNYDNEKSRDESDFRVQVRARDWNAVRDFCVEHFTNAGTGVIEADIKRELAEEFEDALGIAVRPEYYLSRNVGI